MVDSHLSKTRSLDELDVLIEKDRLAAASGAKTLFNQAIAAAINNVSQINQIANARIQANAHAAAARISSGVEVYAVELIEHARAAIETIKTQLLHPPKGADAVRAIVVEVGQAAETQISESATIAINAINQQAEASIHSISDGAKESIQQIRQLATDVGTEVQGKAAVAAVKLAADMASERKPESVVKEAGLASQKILLDTHATTVNLAEKAAAAIAEINRMTASSIKNMGALVQKAEARILSVRDFALTHIQEFLGKNL